MSCRAGPEALVDLEALAANYRLLCQVARPATVAAAVKANAYGLGLQPVGRTLFESGCRVFFVAHFGEALALRKTLPQATIAVLHGLVPAEFAEAIARRIVPVVNDLESLEAWQRRARQRDAPLPALVHLDSGMNRLGLSRAEQASLAADPARLDGIAVRGWMSHLACAEDPDHPKTAEQRAAFKAILARLPRAPASLANSAGIFRGRDYLFDLVRPGAALYGINPLPGRPNPMRDVVTVRAPIVQIRCVEGDATVGYGATHAIPGGRRLATVAIGYADGYRRDLGNRGRATLEGHRVPVVGRVSMDLITLDVSAVPEALAHRGAMVEFIGPDNPIDRIAVDAGTIGYEILTGLGPRIARVYRPAPLASARSTSG